MKYFLKLLCVLVGVMFSSAWGADALKENNQGSPPAVVEMMEVGAEKVEVPETQQPVAVEMTEEHCCCIVCCIACGSGCKNCCTSCGSGCKNCCTSCCDGIHDCCVSCCTNCRDCCIGCGRCMSKSCEYFCRGLCCCCNCFCEVIGDMSFSLS